MTVLANMGGDKEQRFDGLAESWDHAVPAFNTLAVECVAAPDAALLPRVPGLADDLFQADETLTRQDVRAVTLAKLMPMRGALLWDIGTGWRYSSRRCQGPVTGRSRLPSDVETTGFLDP